MFLDSVHLFVQSSIYLSIIIQLLIYFVCGKTCNNCLVNFFWNIGNNFTFKWILSNLYNSITNISELYRKVSKWKIMYYGFGQLLDQRWLGLSWDIVNIFIQNISCKKYFKCDIYQASSQLVPHCLCCCYCYVEVLSCENYWNHETPTLSI